MGIDVVVTELCLVRIVIEAIQELVYFPKHRLHLMLLVLGEL
jgi:hypothetical protein